MRLVAAARPAGTWWAWPGWAGAWLRALALVAALRVGLGLLMALAWLTVARYLPAGTAAVAAGGLPAHAFPLNLALDVWARWDAVHYLGLAQRGYFGVSPADSIYYPLYPTLVAAARPVAGGDVVLAGLLVSSGAAVAALALLQLLAERRHGAEAGRWAGLALAVYPTAFFLLAPFSESLFLALTLGAFLAADGRRWWLAGALAALAALARGPGLLTAPALAVVGWQQWRAQRALGGARQAWAIAGACALPVLAGGAFLAWRQAAGFAPVGVILREVSGVELLDPVRGLWHALAQLARVRDLPVVLDLSSAALFTGLGAAMLARPRWRVAGWLVYFGLNLLFFLSKRSLTAASLQSLARYVLVLFPAFVMLGDWLARQPPRVRFATVTLSSAGLLALSALYALWWFIG